MNFLQSIKAKLTRNNSMNHALGSGGSGSNPFFNQSSLASLFGRFANTQVDYASECGDLTQNRLIMSAVNFLGRNLPEAPIEVVEPKADGTRSVVFAHPLTKLFARPNRFYTGDLLWKSFGLSWIISGNVFFYKVRNKLGEVIELWYLPHFAIEPRWSGNNFIDYYAYSVDGQEHRIAPADIVHLRNGIDPHNTRMGLSDVASALREIYTDNEAANFSALLMKNSGVPPFALIPKNDLTGLKPEDISRLQNSFMRKITGDERGKPAVSTKAFDLVKTGFSPEELDLSKLRRLPEETIASLTGIPAVVLQFGAGLEHSTYANYNEARTSAYEDVIVPLWRYIQAELTHQLLADFDKTTRQSVQFNLSEVRALQDDQNKLFNRLATAYKSDFMKRSEARSRIGLPVEDADAVYFSEASQSLKTLANAAAPAAA
jgi:HK97 family phage portal protein